MLHTVTKIVRTVAATIPDRRGTTAPDTLDALHREFTELDDALCAALRGRLDPLTPAGGCWVVDALDGAVQYLQGLPQWCVSVALLVDEVPTLTVLHSPHLGETYTAVAGGGAHRDGAPIRPSTKTDPAAALAATSHPHVRQPDANRLAGLALPRVLDTVAAVRNLGPTSWQVADVAAGRVDLFWQYGRDSENLLGASLVAAEAGAVVSTAAGAPWTPGAADFLVAAPGLHAAAVRVLTVGADLLLFG
ncbi:inositol monophosphatase family protein [Actinokineospora auranticolor]|uniref:Myo-inositol-1(Or 4)-monophosphatase n=1 Tax=Actinokineospora auranticolor TaxID=155976 RepID=A0A2S6H1K7_9PSEU|nr:inositol monophosphatase family protein [Actinokineospora auranticolor]PPK71365.1 myo-inositol-1(or 4)-monophosphatase [Actinokineospora auranticolor]